MSPGIQRRKRIVRAIARLDDRDFAAVVSYLLGNDAKQPSATRVLNNILARK